MSDRSEDELSEAVLEGDAYAQAIVQTKRYFSLSLEGKILACAAGLGLSTLLAPAVWVRRDLALSLEEGATLSQVLGTRLSALALLGVVTVLLAGLLLLRQQVLLVRRSYTVEEARDVVRVQEIFMWFAVTGIVFILIPVFLGLLGVLSPDAVRWLYSNSVVIYRVGEPLAIDVRITSAIGGASALALAAGSQYFESRAGPR